MRTAATTVPHVQQKKQKRQRQKKTQAAPVAYSAIPPRELVKRLRMLAKMVRYLKEPDSVGSFIGLDGMGRILRLVLGGGYRVRRLGRIEPYTSFGIRLAPEPRRAKR